MISFILGSGDAPSGKVNRYLPPTLAKLLPQATLPASSNNKPPEPLFQLTYEYKPFRSSFDYKYVCSLRTDFLQFHLVKQLEWSDFYFLNSFTVFCFQITYRI